MIPWVTGDVITADRLNAMPNLMIAEYTTTDGQNWSCNKTFNELKAHINNGGYVIASNGINYLPLTTAGENELTYAYEGFNFNDDNVRATSYYGRHFANGTMSFSTYSEPLVIQDPVNVA